MNLQNSGHISLPWVLTVDFDKEKHLFSDKIKTNYKINAYSCSCGNSEIIIYNQSQIIKYICLECDNKHFNDVSMDQYEFSNFKRKQLNRFRYRVKIVQKDDKIFTKLSFSIPDKINLSSNTLRFKEVILYEVSIDSFGNFNRNYSSEASDFIQNIEREMIKYIKYNDIISVPRNCIIFPSISKLAFSLKNKILLSGNYKLRNRKEKSILKTIYQQYNILTREDREVYAYYLEVIMDNIKDPNLVCRLLNMTISRRTMYFFASHRMLFDHRMLFEKAIVMLKSYNYSEIQITNFLTKTDDGYLLFNDLINELDYIRDKNILGFRKVPCNIKSLHDEAVRCTKEHRKEEMYNVKFIYNELLVKPCILLEGYDIKLPDNGKELIEWADTLYNCMASYSYSIQNKLTTIYGFFKNDFLIFAVEIQQEKLIEASAKDNRQLNNEEQYALDVWMNKFFPISKDKDRGI